MQVEVKVKLEQESPLVEAGDVVMIRHVSTEMEARPYIVMQDLDERSQYFLRDFGGKLFYGSKTPEEIRDYFFKSRNYEAKLLKSADFKLQLVPAY